MKRSICRVDWRRCAPLLSAIGVLGCAEANAPAISAPSPARVASVEVNAPADSLLVGEAMALTSTLRDVAGTVLVGRSVQWTSSDPSIASVSSTGTVTATSVGTVLVTASSEGRTGQAALRIVSAWRASIMRDTLVVLSVPTLTWAWAPFNPQAYPNPRIQPSGMQSDRILAALAPVVRADAYDFVLVYATDSVPGWINSGPRWLRGATNLGWSSFLTPPTGWSRLRGMPSMNWLGYFDPVRTSEAYGPQTAIHEMAHFWGVYITGGTGGPRAWKRGDPVAHLAGCCAHWSWNWRPDPTHPGFQPPGILYSGPTDPRFNAFDLYAMGLMPYAEARQHRYIVYDINDGTEYPVTVDSLIAALRLTGTATGDGRRMPDTDPTATRMRALMVLVTPQGRSLEASEENILMDLARRLPPAWSTATWGRSTLEIDVVGR
jgi:hypothetical protein